MVAVQINNNFLDPCLRGGRLAPEQSGISVPKIKKLVKAICNRFKLSNAMVSVAIVDDAQIRRINNQFLNKKTTTDCLSFDLSDDPTPHQLNQKTSNQPESKTGPPDEGQLARGKTFELIINGELAAKQANLRGNSYEAELALYITHGLLHNLGFDDSTRNKAKKMHKTEDEILQQLGYGSVYNKSA